MKAPDYSTNEIPAPIALQSSLEAALKTKNFIEGSWPNASWWEEFNDPQLSKFIEEGIQNNPDLKKTEARVRESLNIAKQIKARLFPHIDFFAQDNWLHLSKHGFQREFAFHAPPPSQLPPIFSGVNFSSFATPVPAVLQVIDIGFDMNWQLDFFGKNRYRLAAAIGEVKAIEAEAQKNRLVISIQIAQTYFSLQTQWALLEVYKELLALRKNQENLSNQRAQIGLDTKSNLLLSEIDISRAEKLILDLEQTALLNQHSLLVLIGENPDSNRQISPAFSTLVAPLSLPQEISSNLLARRPDLMASIWRVEQAAYNINVAKTEFYPEVNLKGLLSLRSVVPDQLFNLSSTENSLFPSLRLPIFKGGQLRANLKEKIALFEEAANDYHATLLKALQEVVDALAQIISISKKIEVQKNILKKTEERAALVKEQFKAGTENYLSTLAMEFESLNQKSILLSLQSDQILFALKFVEALGGGYQSPHAVPSFFINSEKKHDS